VVVAAVLHALGERFSLFHVAAFLLVIGLGFGLCVVLQSETWDLGGARTHRLCLVVCSTTTILVFGVLAFSQIPVLRAIGLTTALGSLACLLFAAFLAESPEKPPLLAVTSSK